jgi:hypothetical protein
VSEGDDDDDDREHAMMMMMSRPKIPKASILARKQSKSASKKDESW